MNTHAGKVALGGYKNKIRRNPRLTRVAAINALLQRTFYDLTKQKKPLENAGKWFHGSFDRYTDPVRPMEIIGEIVDWAKSPYTLEEIASVFPQERKRQETQWRFPEALHRPFASCVALYHHLPDNVSEAQGSISEEKRGISAPETIQQDADVLSRSHTDERMNRVEAEQVAVEIGHEASWYLDTIHVHPEPQLGENTYVVEAFIAETTFPVVYASRQDWWQGHQEQLKLQNWEQQRGGERGTHQR